MARGQPQCRVWDWGSSKPEVGWELPGVTVGGDEGGSWGHSCFPSRGGCFSRGILAQSQGGNKDTRKLWRRDPSQHGTAGVSRQHSSPSYCVPLSAGQVTGVSQLTQLPGGP